MLSKIKTRFCLFVCLSVPLSLTHTHTHTHARTHARGVHILLSSLLLRQSQQMSCSSQLSKGGLQDTAAQCFYQYNHRMQWLNAFIITTTGYSDSMPLSSQPQDAVTQCLYHYNHRMQWRNALSLQPQDAVTQCLIITTTGCSDTMTLSLQPQNTVTQCHSIILPSFLLGSKMWLSLGCCLFKPHVAVKMLLTI